MTEDGPDRPNQRAMGPGRLEAFSDGVFAIAITLLGLELAIEASGTALERVLAAWPSYLAYIVSFLTIGVAWLSHSAITDRLVRVDPILLRLNLLLLLFVSFLPFPTRLVTEEIGHISDERVFVTMYGLTLLAIRIMLFGFDEYAHRKHLYGPGESEKKDSLRRTIAPVAIAYVVAMLVGLLVPAIGFGLYSALAIYLVVPFRELGQLFFNGREGD